MEVSEAKRLKTLEDENTRLSGSLVRTDLLNECFFNWISHKLAAAQALAIAAPRRDSELDCTTLPNDSRVLDLIGTEKMRAAKFRSLLPPIQSKQKHRRSSRRVRWLVTSDATTVCPRQRRLTGNALTKPSVGLSSSLKKRLAV